MPASIRFLGLYVCASFLVLAVLMLWPHNTDKLLVFVPSAPAVGASASFSQDAQFFSVTANSNARLLNKVGRHGFVIAVPDEEGGTIVEQLYQNGAFLVLNAANLDGCGEPDTTVAFRRDRI